MGVFLRNTPTCSRERDALARDRDLGGGGRPDGAAPQESEEGRGLAAKEETYAELRRLWDREEWDEDEDADRRAYDAAITRGADPNEIFEAARLRVATIDAPRYLKPLWKWLDREGWRKPPPPKKRQQQSRRSSATEIAQEWARQADARLGGMPS